MKKLRFIFIFVFLSGIICSIFQYIPVLEEEFSNTVELAKKSVEDDFSGNDSDESGSDIDDALNTSLLFSFGETDASSQLISKNKNDYNSFFKKINIPPPKI